jgi:hypothetical protein
MSVEIQTTMNLSRGTVRHGVVRATALRSTLLGEYVSLLIMGHSFFGAIWWVAAVPKNPAALIMVLSGLWIAFRAVGGLAGEKSTAAISVLMLIMTGVLAITGVSRVPEWMTGSIIAPIVSTILLGVFEAGVCGTVSGLGAGCSDGEGDLSSESSGARKAGDGTHELH